MEQEGRGPSWAALGSGCEGRVCRLLNLPAGSLPHGHIGVCVCLTAPWVLGGRGCVGPSCQLGPWCNLPAEPLPELRVPLGVGKLPSANSPAGSPGASRRAGHTSQPCGLTHRKCWGWGAGNGGGATLGVPCYACGPTDSAAPPRPFGQQPRGHRWDPGPGGYNHVSQEAQCLLWGLRMVGDEGGQLKGWE